MFCGNCGNKLDDNAKFCGNCGEKFINTNNNSNNNKKKEIPKWAIVLIVFIIVCVVIASGAEEKKTSDNNKYEQNKKNKVTVVDFSTMTEVEIDTWCENNKINCKISRDYSDEVEKDKFINQSVEINKEIYEGDKIIINYSLGKKPTSEQKNALKQAESYSEALHMSKQAIYDQLTSQYGGKFEKADAQYAIDNISADWNANALESAKSYRDSLNMSRGAIYDQLISQYGGKFTKSEAQYAIDHLDD